MCEASLKDLDSAGSSGLLLTMLAIKFLYRKRVTKVCVLSTVIQYNCKDGSN